MPQRDNKRVRKGDYTVRNTWKEKRKLKKWSKIKNKIPFKNQKVFSTNHKEFKIILKTDSFFL